MSQVKVTLVVDETELVRITRMLKHASKYQVERIGGERNPLHRTAAAPAEPELKTPRYRPGNGKTSIGVLLKHFTPRGEFEYDIAQRWLVDEGYAPTTIDGTLHQLKKQGKVAKAGDKYIFLKP